MASPAKRVGGFKKSTTPRPSSRRYEGGPVGTKKVVKKTVASARKALPKIQAARTARFGHGANRGPDTLSAKRIAPPKRTTTGKDPMSLGVIGDVGAAIGKLGDTVMGRGKTLVPKVKTGRPAVLPYVKQTTDKAKKASK